MKINFIFKNFSFVFLVVLLFNKVKANSVIKFNLEYVPKSNHMSKKNNIKSHEEIVQELYNKDFITKIDIGTPPKNIPFFININDPYFYFISPISTNKTKNKNNDFQYYNYTDKELFNESLSSSFIKEKCYPLYRLRSNDIEICDAKENILFNINNNYLIQKEFPIKLMRNKGENIPGYLGLLFNSSINCIVELLKQKNIIDDYNFFFNFEAIAPLENKVQGQLIIGKLPHEIFPNKFSIDNYVYTSAYVSNFLSGKWRLPIDKIYINDKYDKFQYLNTLISLSYEIYQIIGTLEMKKVINNLFLKELIKEKKCFSSNFTQNINGLQIITFYYCEKAVKNILYENFTSIKFYSNKLEYVFELTNEELFYIKDDYIYLNILFTNPDNNIWTMGQIFTTKYNFVFNTNQKQIGLYKNINNDKVYNKSDKNNNIYIILCFIICILICIYLGIIFARKIFGWNRKIIANEIIEELNYEYKIENDTVKPNIIKNKNDMNKKNLYMFEMKNKLTN